MSFDAAKYKNSVLLPLAKDKSRLDLLKRVVQEVQGATGARAAAKLDMAELFAISQGMSAADLASHLKSLEMTCNKQKNLPSASLLKKLLDQLGKDKILDPAFWASLAADRSAALKGQLADFAHAVAEEHPLDVVTPEQLADHAAVMGLSAVAESELVAALAVQGVQVCDDFNVPSVDLKKIRKVSDFPEFRTVVDVVLREDAATDIAVVDELTFGNPPRRIVMKDVRDADALLKQQQQRVEPAALHAAQNALAALSLLSSDDDLHDLVLALSLIHI